MLKRKEPLVAKLLKGDRRLFVGPQDAVPLAEHAAFPEFIALCNIRTLEEMLPTGMTIDTHPEEYLTILRRHVKRRYPLLEVRYVDVNVNVDVN